MNRLMQNNKVLVLLVSVLLISNIFLLFYFLVWRKQHKNEGGRNTPRRSIVEFVQREIGFSDSQTVHYRELFNNHRDSLRILGEANQKAKNEFFGLLRENNVSDSAIQVASHALSLTQEAIELNNFRHFQRVRALCTPEQAPRFDSLLIRMTNRPPWYRGGGPRQDSGKEKRGS